ncbi:AraC family transcriptional regulator [uncultured Psychrobacter sp.]|uniref:AraC family transcriptional regulator n=1 Tax=uncultured Psychrobacter sp. TaxID=259303 RepID=UPI0025921710|nr:AraC family transcriptional regulator [uncultured Psychrobacter sp.]
MNNIPNPKRLFIRTYGQQPKGHSHSHPQITIPLTGTINMIMNNEVLNVHYGEAVVIPNHTFHQFKAQENFRFLVINLPETFNLNRLLQNNVKSNNDNYQTDGYQNSDLHFYLDEKILLFIHFIEKQLTTAGNNTIEALMLELFTELICCIDRPNHPDPRIIKVINKINQDIAAPHCIASLADTACLSPSQFKVVFKQQLGCLPNDYITQRRMQKALGLILNTDLPLTIIAEQCGYRSVPAFIRRFRATYNQTPNKMRIKP